MKLQIIGDSGNAYILDTTKFTCTCIGFKFAKSPKSCKHLDTFKAKGVGSVMTPPPQVEMFDEAPKPPAPPPPPPPMPVSQDQLQTIKQLDKMLLKRVGKNHILRDFMYSTRADVLGVQNAKFDYASRVIEAAETLCYKVINPLEDQFGTCAITYGYQSRKLIEAGYPAAKPHSSAPHQWDRGTFNEKVYARVDLLPLSIGQEGGPVDKYEVGYWMMMNLDIDLLMFWQDSDVMCVTISPKPRRVWLEWMKKGGGENGTNKTTYWGENFWQNIYPNMDEDSKPKFGPSLSEGKMYFK